MHSKFKKQIFYLKNLITNLKLDPTNLDLLLNIQLSIIENIKTIEAIIKEIKSNNKNSKKAKCAMNIFKNFGDSIVFIFMNKFNLKQLSLDINKNTLRQSSGFISDKVGLVKELEELKRLISKNIPCILCDITNSVRYGDN